MLTFAIQTNSQMDLYKPSSHLLKSQAKHLSFGKWPNDVLSPVQERTISKWRRLFTLSSKISHSQSRRMSAKPQTQFWDNSTTSGPNFAQSSVPKLRMPSLILPTPSPGPEIVTQTDCYFSADLGCPISNCPSHSSSASQEDDDDDFDLAYLRGSALGRLSPGPSPTSERCRDKALVLLGIITPRHPNPTSSSTSPFSNYKSRHNPRQSYVDDRSGRLNLLSTENEVTPKFSAQVASLAEQKTPVERDRYTQSSPLAGELPSTESTWFRLRPQASKSIDHFNVQSETQQPSVSSSIVPLTKTQAPLERSHSVPVLASDIIRSTSPIQCCTSMNHSPSNSGDWGAVVCTALAKTVVAAGQPRMV